MTTDRYVLPKAAGLTPPSLATFSNPEFPAQNYIDLSATFDFGDRTEIFGGINNVFDEDPPIVAGFGGYGNTFPATYDYAGMTMFLGFKISTF